MDTANAVVPRITPAQGRDLIAEGNTLILDVRDAPEVANSGKVAMGADKEPNSVITRQWRTRMCGL